MGHILEHVAIELQNVAGEPVTFGKTRSHGATRTLPRRLPVRAGGRGTRGRPARRSPCSTRCCPAELQTRGRGTRGLRLRRGAGRVHPVRPAPRARAQHHGAGAGGRGAADSLDPAQRAEPDPVRARPVSSSGSRPPSPAAPRTSPSSSPPTRRRPTASSATWACRCRSSGWSRRAEDAVAAAERIGYPVVVKPFNANHGRGISIHLTDCGAGARQAFEIAREHSRSVIVESFITGDDHRMLVVNGELVAVAQAGARATWWATACTPSSSWWTR